MAEAGAQQLVPQLVRHFLRHEHEQIDPRLPGWLDELHAVGAGERARAPPASRLQAPCQPHPGRAAVCGCWVHSLPPTRRCPHSLPSLPSLPSLTLAPRPTAGECWHKASTFHHHLLSTYKILKIWGQPALLCDTMLFHSAYGNSFVNLEIFRADVDRTRLAGLVSECGGDGGSGPCCEWLGRLEAQARCHAHSPWWRPSVHHSQRQRRHHPPPPPPPPQLGRWAPRRRR